MPLSQAGLELVKSLWNNKEVKGYSHGEYLSSNILHTSCSWRWEAFLFEGWSYCELL